ncbi:MAG: CoA transferase [Alphaproteobacteria bacterium]|nr:CoA transferase [Alphaproteobacteria bacterium]MBU0798716.1 CoA transferase [Alphaproteobacteria bacterium]MBU0885979.1 CoA transferase [Alphaproteobacteria bacterium]MBU1811968.1 CoA transferase [Alphaproteobacteria bacterium]MBU2089803.1 CoA transferase [Alphaproteobacteria bacterium]
MGALDGLLVVALEQAVAAPLCTAKLADAGARVIKIERVEGDFARGYDRAVNGQSSYFVWLNRGKESLTLDIKNPDDKALLTRILAKADVFVQNLLPGAAGRAGFGSEELRQRHPGMITVDISGYGDSGPMAEMKAYDLLVQAESGVCSVTGTATDMARVGISIGDIGAGMNAYAAVLEALIQRGITGKGAAIQVSLFDGLADWMNVPYLQYAYGGTGPARIGLGHATIQPYGAYQCADGQIMLAIQNEREWVRLCAEVLGQPGLATDERFNTNVARCANRPALTEAIESVFRPLTRAQASALLKAAQIAFASVNTVEDLKTHPALRLTPMDTPEGPVEIIAPAPITDGKSHPMRPMPAIGQHSHALRQEFA